MPRPALLLLLKALVVAGTFSVSLGHAQRPDLLFREDWKEIPAELPVNQNHVANPDLILHLHGASPDLIKKSNHDKPADDPYYIWSGRSVASNWAVSLEPKSGPFDLTGQAKVRWRAKQSGFRILRIIVQLENNEWLVSDVGDGPSDDWREREFVMANIKWRKLNMELIVEEHPVVTDADLSRVKQIGFTDLMTRGNSRACSRLDWIEVYARPSS
jgi:hypothetical protein